jgi:catechol 2,3-dioxygenase-like lactoylglutathione lyase family enzyme
VAGVTAPLDHVTLAARDLAASAAFYDAALAPLGLRRVVELVDEEEDAPPTEAVGYGAADGADGGDAAVLWLVSGTPPARPPTTGVHLSLRAPSAEAVRAFHDAAVAAGGTSHDAPRRWPIFRRGAFNAIVADPDGNLVEAVSAEPGAVSPDQ